MEDGSLFSSSAIWRSTSFFVMMPNRRLHAREREQQSCTHYTKYNTINAHDYLASILPKFLSSFWVTCGGGFDHEAMAINSQLSTLQFSTLWGKSWGRLGNKAGLKAGSMYPDSKASAVLIAVQLFCVS